VRNVKHADEDSTEEKNEFLEEKLELFYDLEYLHTEFIPSFFSYFFTGE
jgi:hypothetical protein